MRPIKQPATIENIRAAHTKRRKEIRARLREFRTVWKTATDDRLWEELVFCIFTAGASARMGLRAIDAVRHLLAEGTHEDMTRALSGVYRYPRARPGYIVITRDHLKRQCNMRLRERLESFKDPLDRRRWLASDKFVKGLGYKEASHFLRNIGLFGYGILDKHVVGCLFELGVVTSPKPPANGVRYLEIEENLRRFAHEVDINLDELDLVLWSMKTGEILK